MSDKNMRSSKVALWAMHLINYRVSSFCEIKQVGNLPNEVWAVPA